MTERLEALERHVAKSQGFGARLGALEHRAAEAAHAIPRLDALERHVAESQGLGGRVEALEQCAAEAQHAITRIDALERHAAEAQGVSASLAALEHRAAEAQHAMTRIDALERHAAEAQGLSARLAALEQRGAEAQHAIARIDGLERHAAELQDAVQRIATALEQRGAAAENRAKLERDRLDWSLATLEGVTAQIDAYHLCRESPEYQAAYNTADPLVSVCVTTMDRADLLLDRSIPSVLAQTYQNLQIIVVGDNCTDNTMQRLAALQDSRIQFVNLPERGPYPRPGMDRWCVAGTNALNHALSLCEGQFVTHLDDDDAMVPLRIEAMVRAALQDRADFLWHKFWYQNPDESWITLGNGNLELGQVTTGAIFYHRYFARIPWDVYAYRLGEPGDWNRLRKIRAMRPRLRYVDELLLHHFAERSQPELVPRAGERFLE